MKNQSGTTWRFIANPVAGGGKVSEQWPQIERALKMAGIAFDVVFTQEKRHAIALAKEAVQQGCRHLAAVGGDGTAHEVVNGIFQQTTCPPEEVTFTLLPIGTGNDWVKEHRIPKDFGRWLHFFQHGKTTFQDVGWLTFYKNGQLEKRWFINVAGLSYDAFVAKKAEAQGAKMANKFFYLLLIFRCLFQFTIPKIRVTFDGQTVEDFLYTINVGICRYSGGGLRLVPQAITNDGKLALTLVKKVTKLEVLLITPLFYTSQIGLHPAVSLHQAEDILVEGKNVLVEADGEFLGEAPVQFGILKRALKILAP
ncbi:MAG: diacylglycerol kinase family lipid kinase [Saprospiraceae bacterium]|nr:MAG: diacylglycerol kinase family lipid kinase [Saprospiraceae bacterium]